MTNFKKILSMLVCLSFIVCFVGAQSVSAHAASIVKPKVTYGETYMHQVAVDELNIRSGPSTGYSAIDSISYGHDVLPIGDNGGSLSTSTSNPLWYYIEYSDNGRTKTGWVKAVINGKYSIN